MARSSIIIGGRGSSTKGLSEYIARLNKIPAAVRTQVGAAIGAAADQLASDVQAITPKSDLEPHPGELRESVHTEDGRTELSRLVMVDAKDAKGHGYAPHVEFGHKTRDGGHVAPEPFFYPSIVRAKPKLRARVSRAMSKAIKDSMN